MAQVSTATLDGLVKRIYSPEDIGNLVNVASQVLADVAARGNANLGGAGFYKAVRTSGARGHAYIAETGDLPNPQQSVVKQWVATPTVHAGVVQLTGLAQAVTSTNAMAFAMAFEENVQQTILGMTAYKEGALFRDGTGKLGVVVSGGGTAALVLDDCGFIGEGMEIQVYDVSTAGGTETYFPAGGSGASYTVIAVDWPTRTVTFSASVSATIAAGDILYIAGSQGPTGTAPTAAGSEREPLGLGASVLTTGTYLGIARASVGTWKANSMTVSAPLDESFLMRGRTRVIQRTGATIAGLQKGFALLCHQIQADQLFKLAIPRIHYGGPNGVDLVNAENVMLGRVPVRTSYQCPTSKAWLADWSKHRTMYTPGGELHIDTKHNGAALKWVAGKDAGQVYMVEYAQFVLEEPHAALLFTGITDPTR